MVNLFLMSQQPCHRLDSLARIPKVHCEIITSTNYPLRQLALNSNRLLKALLSLGPLTLIRVGNRCVIKVTRAQRKVGRQGKMIHPMRMRRKRMHKRPLISIPNADILVMRARVNQPGPAPFNTANRALMTGKNMLRPARVDTPYAHRTIFTSTRQPRRAILPQVIRLPGNVSNPLSMTRQRTPHSLARLRIPQSYRLIHTPCRKPLPIRTPRDTQHPMRMPRKRKLGRASLSVPYARRLVAGAGGESGAVGRAKLCG